MPAVTSSASIVLLLLLDLTGIASFQPKSSALVTSEQRHQLHDRVCCFSTPSPASNNINEQDEEAQSLFPGRKRRARKKKKKRQEEDYQRRREQWLERYGSLQALQTTFGAGPPWGDLSPEQTRRLYHTLLPRSLLGLYEMGLMQPDELAPLAYEARIAAKEYARSRCVWTGKLVTAAFDQYRKLQGYNSRDGSSSKAAAPMTWERIWAKYENQIAEEDAYADDEGDEATSRRRSKRKEKDEKDNQDLTKRIYLRILERSVETNRAFDKVFLKNRNHDPDEIDELAEIAAQLEKDVRDLLLHPKDNEKIMEKEEKARKQEQKAKEKEEKKREKEEKKQRKLEEKLRKKEGRT